MLSKLFHRRYLISLSYLLVVIIGIIAWKNISLEMSPDLSLMNLFSDSMQDGCII